VCEYISGFSVSHSLSLSLSLTHLEAILINGPEVAFGVVLFIEQVLVRLEDVLVALPEILKNSAHYRE
jgi:hypothetical protein